MTNKLWLSFWLQRIIILQYIWYTAIGGHWYQIRRRWGPTKKKFQKGACMTGKMISHPGWIEGAAAFVINVNDVISLCISTALNAAYADAHFDMMEFQCDLGKEK